MANGIVDLQELYDFDSFGGTVTSPGQSEEIDKFISDQGLPNQQKANDTQNTNEFIGGIPIDQTMITSPELARKLMDLNDLYKTDYTAEDFLPEDAKTRLKDIGQIGDEEIDDFLDKFAPETTAEELSKLFPKEDYKFEKRMSLAKLGLNLMQPTMGGQVGAVIANAGKELTTDLAFC